MRATVSQLRFALVAAKCSKLGERGGLLEEDAVLGYGERDSFFGLL